MQKNCNFASPNIQIKKFSLTKKLSKLANRHLFKPQGIKTLLLQQDGIKGQSKEVLKALNIPPVSDMIFTRSNVLIMREGIKWNS